MKNTIILTLLSVIICLGMACQSDSKKEDAKQTKSELAFESGLPKAQLILSQCDKVEFMMNNVGVTFETQGNSEVMRFFSYIMNKPADQSKCKKGTYDGGAVFKNPEGDIKMTMEFNISDTCNRVVFVLDGKEYAHPLNVAGTAFFKQVLGNTPFGAQ